VSALEPDRILVAEDDEDFRHVMQLTLEREFPSTTVECVADGRAALSWDLDVPKDVPGMLKATFV